MQRILRNIILLGMVGLSSCQKELDCDTCPQTNKPPVANAGPDQLITLPTDSVFLDASASHDPDGSIASFQWSILSGPSLFSIASIPKPLVKNLSAGTYVFEVKATDNEGLPGRDTVMITVDAVLMPNRPPIAHAGPDQTVILPVNSVKLDGSNSTDLDNNISAYTWTKISGPSTFNIINPSAMQTSVTGLVQGVYQFELKVTDAGGLFDTDTMEVKLVDNNPASSDCVIPGAIKVASFPTPKVDLASTVCKNKFYYSDGWTMDVFDPVSNTIISSSNLSMGRSHVAAISAGDKVFFAGGYNYPPTTTSQGTYQSRIDMYNTTTGTWTTSELSIPRILSAGTCTLGNKVFFAGGLTGPNSTTTRIDIYDLSTNSWTYRELSKTGSCLTAIVQGKAWFITPGSGNIDVYDGATDSWSIMNLNSPIGTLIASTYNYNALQIGNKIYFTGAQKVNVYDVVTQSWSAISLRESKFFIPAIVSNGKIAFIGGMTSWFTYSKTIEIYDPATDSWSIRTMDKDLYYEALIPYNNFIYSAGGMVDNENTSLSGICRFGL